MPYRDRPKAVSQAANKKYYNKTSNARNGKSRFTEQELLLIWQHNITDMELSKRIGRSVQSIQIARSRMRSGIIKVEWVNAT